MIRKNLCGLLVGAAMLCLLFSSCAAAGPEDGKSDSVLMMERIETVI